MSRGFVQFIGGIVRMIFVAVAMFLVDWRLALATLTVVPMMIGVSTYLSRLARKAFRESANRWATFPPSWKRAFRASKWRGPLTAAMKTCATSRVEPAQPRRQC
ncbi:MAG: ABC transporter transmembrane domain-containing protein [Caldilineaceae bacterium]